MAVEEIALGPSLTAHTSPALSLSIPRYPDSSAAGESKNASFENEFEIVTTD